MKSSKQAFMEGLTTGLQAPTTRGEQLILLHVGSEAGFLEDAICLFRVRKGSGDYHDEMDVSFLKVGFLPP